MLTIKLFDRRVDIEMMMGWKHPHWYNYHCYLFRDNYLYHYRFKDTMWDALKFLIGYDTQ